MARAGFKRGHCYALRVLFPRPCDEFQEACHTLQGGITPLPSADASALNITRLTDAFPTALNDIPPPKGDFWSVRCLFFRSPSASLSSDISECASVVNHCRSSWQPEPAPARPQSVSPSQGASTLDPTRSGVVGQGTTSPMIFSGPAPPRTHPALHCARGLIRTLRAPCRDLSALPAPPSAKPLLPPIPLPHCAAARCSQSAPWASAAAMPSEGGASLDLPRIEGHKCGAHTAPEQRHSPGSSPGWLGPRDPGWCPDGALLVTTWRRSGPLAAGRGPVPGWGCAAAQRSMSAKATGSEIRTGNIIERKGRMYEVVKAQHTQQGRGGATVQVELRDVRTGLKTTEKLRTSEPIEVVFVDAKPFSFLYFEGDIAHLMDPESYEQLGLPRAMFGNAAALLQEGAEVQVKFFNGEPLMGKLPQRVTVRVEQAEPHVKGDTATPSYKRVRVQGGLQVSVPPFVEEGDAIVVQTDDLSYVTRAKGT